MKTKNHNTPDIVMQKWFETKEVVLLLHTYLTNIQTTLYNPTEIEDLFRDFLEECNQKGLYPPEGLSRQKIYHAFKVSNLPSLKTHIQARVESLINKPQ